MKIAFDYQIFAAQKYGGISRYFTALARELSLMGERPRIIAPVHGNQYLGELSPNLVAGWRGARYFPPHTDHMQETINILMTQALMSTWRPHVVHETFYARARSGPRGTPAVTTVHDMLHEVFPDQFPTADGRTALKREAVRRADHIVCVSANTRDDLVRLFGCAPDRLSVIHHGTDHPPRLNAIRDTVHAGVDGPFLLYVGFRWGYKNFLGMLEAFASSTTLRWDFRIVAFGAGAFSPEEVATIERLGLTGRVVHMTGSDATLDLLYRQAFALVYPSLYEGFGLPALEAMARGCPVISSNSSSMPEVIGDAGELFDPKDVGAMARSMESVAYSDDYRRALIGRGTARVTHFSWRRCAEETLTVYRTLAAE